MESLIDGLGIMVKYTFFMSGIGIKLFCKRVNVADQVRLFTVACIRLVGSALFFVFDANPLKLL